MVRIDSVKFGEITIDGKTYYSDVIVYWNGRMEYREKSHELDINEFLKIAEEKPEAIVVGTGMEGMSKVSEEVEIAAEDKNIKIFKDISPKAIDIFNSFVADGRRVVAVIHTTS